MAKIEIPLWEKACLTIDEAAAYSNIGTHRLRDIMNEKNCDFVLCAGTKKLIKKKQFLQYLDRTSVL